MKIVNYLDATFNLNTGTTSPYRKADNETDYIHAESDHPPNIIRQLPLSVGIDFLLCHHLKLFSMMPNVITKKH